MSASASGSSDSLSLSPFQSQNAQRPWPAYEGRTLSIMDEGSIGNMGNEEYENLYDPVDDVVTRLRLATVQDSAESIYELMAEAADQIELQRSLNSSLAACFASSESEVRRLRGEVVETDATANSSQIVSTLLEECICYNAWGPDEFPCLECQAREEIERLLKVERTLRAKLRKFSAWSPLIDYYYRLIHSDKSN